MRCPGPDLRWLVVGCALGCATGVTPTTDPAHSVHDSTPTNGGQGTSPTGSTGIPGTTPSPTPPPTDSAPCTATLLGSLPGDGDTDLAVDQDVLITFSAPVAEADLLVSSAVAAVTVNLAGDGLSANVAPDPAWPAGGTVELDVTVCDVTSTLTWTTAGDGLDPNVLVGRTYAIEYSSLVWVTPTNADILVPDIDAIALQVTAADDTTLDALVGTATLDGAALEADCETVLDAGSGDFSDSPIARVGPVTLTIPAGAVDIVIENFEAEMAFASPAGDEIHDITVSGRIDTRELGLGSCVLVALFAGGTCVACTDGALQCLDAVAEASIAPWEPALDLSACP